MTSATNQFPLNLDHLLRSFQHIRKNRNQSQQTVGCEKGNQCRLNRLDCELPTARHNPSRRVSIFMAAAAAIAEKYWKQKIKNSSSNSWLILFFPYRVRIKIRPYGWKYSISSLDVLCSSHENMRKSNGNYAKRPSHSPTPHLPREGAGQGAIQDLPSLRTLKIQWARYNCV